MMETEINTRQLENEYVRLFNQIGWLFSSDAGFNNAQNYVKCLLGTAERKNGWQMSEYVGAETPYQMQQFIYRGRYSANGLQWELREYVAENIGEDGGVLVVDDTGFLKKGDKSCGVQRQYTGTAGKIANCQIGVFLTYASSKGHCPIDRRLYMPEEWMKDGARLKAAGVPEGLEFETKPEMALEMVQSATAAGVPYKWVTGDCAYGDCREMRQWLEANEKNYVMCVSGKEYIWAGYRQVPVSSILKNLAADGWFEASCGEGSKGERLYDWQAFEMESDWRGALFGDEPRERKHVMLVRRSQEDHGDMRAHICYAPADTPNEKLIEVAGTRWTVESCFEEAKGEVGMDQYEFRSYDGWHRHITFACLALALLTVASATVPVASEADFEGKTMQQCEPAIGSLDEFKKKRGLLA